jgi:hypothetical protein
MTSDPRRGYPLPLDALHLPDAEPYTSISHLNDAKRCVRPINHLIDSEDAISYSSYQSVD